MTRLFELNHVIRTSTLIMQRAISAVLGLTAVCLVVACSTPTPSSVNAKTQAVPLPSQAAPSAPITVESKPSVVGVLHPTRLTSKLTFGEGSYATHPRLQTLATQLAQSYLLDEDWVMSALSQARFNATVAKLIMPAANPGAKNWAVYQSRFIEPVRIRKGRAFWYAYQDTLQKASLQYGVPAEIIAGIIGVETIYGQQTGQFRVLDVLSTLTLDFPVGRKDRSAFFRAQLGEFLRLCAEQQWDPRDVLGSYAGAMGLPQFMPSSIRQFAVDYDGDGQIDLNKSVPDVIGSVANFLSKHGWQPNTPTHFNVQVPSDPASLAYLLGPDIVPSFSVNDFHASGASLDASGEKHIGLLALVKLENGENLPTYIAGTENFFAITRYNNSSYYALAVIALAKSIAPKSTQE